MDNILLNSLIALLLGTAIGLKTEREKGARHGQNLLGGFRTHGILALMGAVSGIFYASGNLLITGLISGSILSLVLIYYASGVFKNNAYGITDEMSAIFAHLIGLLLILQPITTKFIIAFVVIIVFVTTRKKMIRGIGKNISEKEVIEYSLFAIIALVILPFLPNKSISLNEVASLEPILSRLIFYKSELIWALEIINPFKIWFIVVFVSGIDLVAHMLSKFVSGSNSQFVSAIIGGFVSSTSTTISIAIRSKTKAARDHIDQLVAAALAANASSFLQILILVTPMSFIFLEKIFIPTLILAVGGYLIAIAINMESKGNVKNEIKEDTRQDNNFKLEPAIKFALLLTLFKLVTKIALVYFGDSGFVISSMFAAMLGMDAIIINVAQLTNTFEITLELAFFTYMAANFVNILSKIVYTFISGHKMFAIKFTLYISLLFILAFISGLII